MKKERLILLLGVLIALIFFYLGLNQWLKTKEEVQPPPLVVETAPKSTSEGVPKTEAPKQEEKTIQKPSEKDLIAEKISEEKREEKVVKEAQTPQEEKPKMEKKVHTVQVGAFLDKEKAQKVAERAKKMGYSVNMVEEDNFYKVRLKIVSEDINSEMKKLRDIFGGAILIR
ncbi:MAG: SPOR domain-containing protein [Aquificaceae bacterium]